MRSTAILTRASLRSRDCYRRVPAFDHGTPIHRPDSLPILLFVIVLIAGLLGMAPRQTHVLTVELPMPMPPNHIGVLSPPYDRITMDAAGTLRWNGTVIDRSGLATLLEAKAASGVATPLLLSPDERASYGNVAGILLLIEQAGLVDRCFRFSGQGRFARYEAPESFAGTPPAETVECSPVYGY